MNRLAFHGLANVTESTESAMNALFEPEVETMVAAALEEYLDALKSRVPLSRVSFLEKHSKIAGLLEDCLAGLEFVASVTENRPDEPGWPTALEGVPPDTQLGDYRIVREIGRGGMGIVYEADQISLCRRVALKVLPFAAALDPRQRQRFQIEAHAAAHLRHPHIVPIFATGCDRGVHYYAMQFIAGRTLAAVIQEQRRLRVPQDRKASPRGSEAFQAIARLGIQAAEALEHAHSLGVLHRDIKPANLMLDAQDQLWITDFGLARTQNDGGLTCTGNLLGTLRYMSPEQARGRSVVVDHRCDLYSLGATLYELLTLQPAFDEPDAQALLNQIILDDPIRPSRIDPSIPKDLETIVLKAMSKDPEARYGHARELADDLKRFLHDQPIQARRPGLVARLTKWSRRHRPVVATALIMLTGALLVGAGVLWLEERKTAAALRETQSLRERELDTLLMTFRLSDALTVRGLENYADTLATGGVADYDRKSHQFYAKIAFEEQLAPKVRAMAFHRLAFTRARLNLPDAGAAYAQSVALFEELLKQGTSDNDVRLELAAVLLDQSIHLQTTQDIDAALPGLRRAIELECQVIEASPRLAHYNLNLRLAFDLYRAYCLLVQGSRKAEAESLIDRCLEQVPRPDLIRNNLAWYLVTQNPKLDPALAVNLAQQAVMMRSKSGECWNTLGVAQYYASNWPAARLAFEASMQLRGGGDPYDWLFLSLVEWHDGDLTDAQKWFQQSVDWMRHRDPLDPYLCHLRDEAANVLGLASRTDADHDDQAGRLFPVMSRLSSRKHVLSVPS